MIEESTDTELSQQTHATMMTTSDQEKHRLEALAREQDHACNEAIKQAQTRHLREVEATADAPCHSFKCRSAVVPLERKTPSGPMKSHLNMAPCPGREATVFNERTSIKQTGFQPRQVKGVRDPRVTHPANVPAHHTTVPRVDTVHPADAALTAGAAAVVPHLTVTGLVIATLHPRNSQWTPNQDQYNQRLHSLLHRRHRN